MHPVWKAARYAREFVISARRENGTYALNWPAVRPRARTTPHGAAKAVAPLRMAQRIMMGFLDPVEDALFMTAALRTLGHPVTFHLGREKAPLVAPGGFYAWAQYGDEVLTTSLPVREEYTEVLRSGEVTVP
ncbi:hypothetical protein ADK65_04305 [Streptomyces sp. NRRL B-1140]|nr:hypothetical protein ADK65_04305 [Streptomyces sp. NRRL B-1140]